MTSAFTRRTWGSSLLIAGMVIPTAAVGGSAFAAPTCAATTPAATLIAPGVCEVVMTASGTFAPPVGVSKVAAVLVGAGGGGYYYASGYAGGGGEVTYVDSVPVVAPLAVTIGTGGGNGWWMNPGDNDEALAGGDTLVGTEVARGGIAGRTGVSGASGSGNLGVIIDDDAPGGGAQSAASLTSPGTGYALSAIPSVDVMLFPAAADSDVEFGQGGSLATASPQTGSGVGGGYVASGPTDEAFAAFDGASGSVTFRFAATDDAAPDGEELAATGANDTALMAAALGLGLMVVGAAVIAQPRRAATRPRSGKA